MVVIGGWPYVFTFEALFHHLRCLNSRILTVINSKIKFPVGPAYLPSLLDSELLELTQRKVDLPVVWRKKTESRAVSEPVSPIGSTAVHPSPRIRHCSSVILLNAVWTCVYPTPLSWMITRTGGRLLSDNRPSEDLPWGRTPRFFGMLAAPRQRTPTRLRECSCSCEVFTLSVVGAITRGSRATPRFISSLGDQHRNRNRRRLTTGKG